MLVVVNGEPQEFDQGLTIEALMSSLHRAPEAGGLAVAVDGEVVPRGAWPRTALTEGARVEVVAAVQGG